MSSVQTAQICPTSVLAVSAGYELTEQQINTLELMVQHCIGPDGVMAIGTIKRLGIFHSHAQAVFQVNKLAELGWLLSHEGAYRPSPKAINWLIAQGARAGLSAVTQEA